MTTSPEPVRVPSSTDGRGFIGKDSKLGLLAFTIVTVVGQAIVEWLGELDFSNAPRLVASIAPILVGLAVGWITTKMNPRH